jgi:hypothetical protein
VKGYPCPCAQDPDEPITGPVVRAVKAAINCDEAARLDVAQARADGHLPSFDCDSADFGVDWITLRTDRGAGVMVTKHQIQSNREARPRLARRREAK